MKKLVLALIVLWAGTTWFVSGWTEKELARQLDQVGTMSHQAVSARLVSYDKGWLKSRAVTSWSMDGTPGGVEFTHTISHGPNPLFGWAKIVSEPVLPEGVSAVISPYFEGSPLTVVTTVDWTGTRKLAIDSPKTDHKKNFGSPASTVRGLPRGPRATFTWHGITGTGELTGKDGWIEIDMPGFESNMPGMGSLNFTGAYFNARSTREEESTLWTGESEAGLESMSLAPLQGDGFQLGKTALKGSDKIESDGTVSSRVRGSVSGLDIPIEEGKTSISRMSLAVTLSNMNKQAFERLSAAMRAPAPATGGSRAETAAFFPGGAATRTAALNVLKGSPVLEITEFSIGSTMGDLDATGRVVFDGNGFSAGRASSMMDYLSRMHITLDASSDQRLLQGLVTRSKMAAAIKQQRGPAGAHELAMRMAREELAGMISSGLLGFDGNVFTLSASMKKGVLRLNGKPADGAMGQLLGRLMSGA